MRPLWIVALITCAVLALATVASASVRHELGSVAAAVTAGLTVPDGDEASPSPDASTEPSPEPSTADDAEAEESGEARPDNHGAAVSAVAKDKEAVGEKTLANGKTISNHGQAVSAVARSSAGKPAQAGGHAEGKDKGGVD